MNTVVSACIEALFTDAGEYPDRIAAAADAGCSAVEMWFPGDKDPVTGNTALTEREMSLRLMLAGPAAALTDPANHDEFIASLPAYFGRAEAFGTDTLIVQSGNTIKGRTRREQSTALREVLAAAADKAAERGIILLYEPLNTRIDHKGYFADDSREAASLVRDIAVPSFRMLLDIYHASVMEEDVIGILEDNLDIIPHLHIADTNGRHEPGTGSIPYPEIFAWLNAAGYEGSFGLEYFPAGDSAGSVRNVLEMIDRAGFTIDSPTAGD